MATTASGTIRPTGLSEGYRKSASLGTLFARSGDRGEDLDIRLLATGAGVVLVCRRFHAGAISLAAGNGRSIIGCVGLGLPLWITAAVLLRRLSAPGRRVRGSAVVA